MNVTLAAVARLLSDTDLNELVQQTEQWISIELDSPFACADTLTPITEDLEILRAEVWRRR